MRGSAQFAGTERFELQDRLGTGGMGVVYRALDRTTGREIALKTLRDFDPDHLFRLKREFRILQGIEHPNLVKLGELIEHAGKWFFTMELIRGTPLLDYVRTNDRGPDESRLRAALGQLCSALFALHDAGIVHRDVKPSNALVTERGRVVLLDFGLAVDDRARAESPGESGLGTVEYMAPEQAGTAPISPAADLYAVGTILFEALTGQLPFTGTSMRVLVDKQERRAPRASSIAPGIPEDLDQLCASLLEPVPTNRAGRDQLMRCLDLEPAESATPYVATTSRVSMTAPLIGRDAELDALDKAFARALDGAMVPILVTGPSGLGKTALIQRFVERLRYRQPDLLVLGGACFENESVPFKAFDGLIDQLAQHLRRLPDGEAASLAPRHTDVLLRLFPILRRVEALARSARKGVQTENVHELRSRGFDALHQLLHRLSERTPLLLWIDDIQWADSDSFQLLDRILDPSDPIPMMLCATSRDRIEELSGALEQIDLDVLEPMDARRLAKTLLRSARIENVSPATIATEARGHPLYIAELVHYTGFAGFERRPRLDEAIAARCAQLSPDALSVLELLCAAGAPIPRPALELASRLAADAFERAVTTLRIVQLARVSGGARETVAYYHDRIRETIVDSLSPRRLLELYSSLAAALDDAGRPELLIRCLEGSGRQQEAADHAIEAAREAERSLAFSRAVALYRKALELNRDDRTRQRELQVHLAEALSKTGRCAQAAEAFLVAADDADPTAALQFRQRAAELFFTGGYLDRGRDVNESLLANLNLTLQRSPKRALASLLWRRLRLKLRGNRWTERHEGEVARQTLTQIDIFTAVGQTLGQIDNVRAADFQARGLLLALKVGEPIRLARAFCIDAVFIGSQGGRGIARAHKLIDEAMEISERADHALTTALATMVRGSAFYFGAQFRAAVDELDRAMELTERIGGATLERNTSQMFRFYSLRHLGQWRQIRSLAPAALRDAVGRGDRFMETSLRRYSNLLYLADDDRAGALANLDAATWTPPEGGYHVQHWFDLEARTELALYAGEVDVASLAREFDAVRRSLLPRIQSIRCLSWWAEGRSMVAAGPPAALRRAGKLARKLLAERWMPATIWGCLLAAGIAARCGDSDSALTQLDRAIEIAEENDLGMYASAAHRRRGQLIGGDEGAAEIRRAEDWMTEQRIKKPERIAEVIAPGFEPV